MHHVLLLVVVLVSAASVTGAAKKDTVSARSDPAVQVERESRQTDYNYWLQVIYNRLTVAVSDIETLKTTTQDLQTENEQLKAENQVLKTSVAELSSNYTRVQGQLDTAEARLGAVQNKVLDLQAQDEATAQLIRDIQSNYNQLLDRTRTLESVSASVQDKLENATSLLINLEERTVTLETNVTRNIVFIRVLATALNTVWQELSGPVQSKLTSLADRANMTEEFLDFVDLRVTDSAQAIEDLQEQARGLGQNLTVVEENVDGIITDLSVALPKITALEDKVSPLEENVELLTSQVGEVEQAVETVRREAAATTSAVQTLNQTTQDLESDLQQTSSDLQQLKQNFTDHVDQVNQNLGQVGTRLDGMASTDGLQTARLDQLNASVSGLDSAVLDLNRMTVQLNSSVDQVAGEVDSLRTDLSTAAGRLQQLSTQTSRQSSFLVTVGQSGDPATFDNVLLNLGDGFTAGGYREATGEYVAPYTGTYFFSASVGVVGALSDGSLGLQLIKTVVNPPTEVVMEVVASGTSSFSETGEATSVQAVVQLSLGDKVHVVLPPLTEGYWGQATAFTGFLIAVDA